MELIITTEEKLEACILRAVQKANSYLQPIKEELPQNIGSEEAKRLLAEIWGSPVSDSLFYKLSHRKELPSRRIGGKRLVFDRKELINYAQSKSKKPVDGVSQSVAVSARKKI
jgi:hypothetical protein